MKYNLLKIIGQDSQSFLQAQASNEVTSLNLGQGQYVSFLDPKAKIKSLAYLIKHSDQEFYLITKDAALTQEHLEKFIIVEDVTVEPIQDLPLDPPEVELEDFTEGDTLIKLNLLDKYVDFDKGCFPGQEPLSKYKHIGLAKKQERSQRYTDEALDVFAQADNNDDEACKRAIELLRKAITEDPSNEDAYESLGVILGRTQRYQEAIKVMHQLEMINPKSIMAQTNLSIFYMKIGDKETAEEYKAKSTVLQFDQALQE